MSGNLSEVIYHVTCSFYYGFSWLCVEFKASVLLVGSCLAACALAFLCHVWLGEEVRNTTFPLFKVFVPKATVA